MTPKLEMYIFSNRASIGIEENLRAVPVVPKLEPTPKGKQDEVYHQYARSV